MPGPEAEFRAAIELALRHADVASKLLQFFLLLNTAVLGLLLTTEPAVTRPVLWWAFGGAYALGAWALIGGLASFAERTRACYALADKLAEGLPGERDFHRRIASSPRIERMTLALPAIAAAVALAIVTRPLW